MLHIKIMRLWHTLRYWAYLFVVKAYILPILKSDPTLITLGSPNASWKVPLRYVQQDSLCYCIGVGEDISFERELYSLRKPKIFLFDPTPRAYTYIQKTKLPKSFVFSRLGVWDKNGKQKFFEPSSRDYVSHSIVNLYNTKGFFLAECKTLSWIMRNFGHKKIDLLKLDIEGAEYSVLSQMLCSSLRPQILAVEFDQPTPPSKTISMIAKILQSGYTLIDQTNWNFIFVYKLVEV